MAVMLEHEVREIVDSALTRYESNTTSRAENLSDAGNARRLVSLHGNNFRFIPIINKWLVWNGYCWAIDNDGEIMRLAKDVARSIHTEAANEPDDQRRSAISRHALASERVGRLNGTIELTKSEKEIIVHSPELDTDDFLICVLNGVVNLRTGALQEPNRLNYITKQASIEYLPDAECKLWYAFLNQIMDCDTELIAFLQRAVGYTLTGSTDEQCLFMMHGNGANGKSVFLRVISFLVGDYSSTTSAETLMVKSGNGSTNDIARLRGARLVAASETEDGHRLAESLIKQMTGQDILTARFLYGEFFEFRTTFKLWLAANHKPVIRGDDYAVWRRIHLLPFEVTIPEDERDPQLTEKLMAELPGIFRWAVEGCLQWQKMGLQPPEKVQAATAEYRQDMDIILQWIDDRCVIAPNAECSAKLLYEDYKEWSKDNVRWFLSQTKFGRKLGEHGFRKGRTSKGNKYIGIALLGSRF